MKIMDFTELTLEDQLQVLYHEGVYLAKRKRGLTCAILYQYETIYVEIFYVSYRSVVSHIEWSESPVIAEPYLGQISVEELLEL